jgi:hypothetical protein
MQHEVGRAAPAARRPAAGLAGKDRRIAPPIDEDQALLAACEPLADRGHGRLGEAVLRGISAQVHGPHHRQLRSRRGALRELEPLVALLAPVVPSLERRRRGAEDDRAAARLRAVDGHVAGGITQAFLLLERTVVLLIDHDQRELGQRREHGQPRAKNDARVAARRRGPRRGSRHVLERAVQHRDARLGESFAKAGLELRRQADLGYQHQRLTARFEHAGDDVQVDLGLAAARDAMQQPGAEAAKAGGDGLRGAGLIRCRGVARRKTRGAEPVRLRQSFLRQRSHRAQARRQRSDDGLAERPLVVAGEEAHQLEPIARQAWRVVAERCDTLDSLRRKLARSIYFDHDADFLTRAERYDDAIAGRELAIIKRGVVEQFRERHIERHPNDRNFPTRQ